MSVPDFRQAGHLPKVRGDSGADARGLPRQRRGITPQMHGRYPDFDCLEQTGHWDEPTRRVVLDRVDHVPEPAFFTPAETACLTALCDGVTAQDGEPRIPVVAFVDQKFAQGKADGYRYADMPEDADTWRRVAAGLDEAAAARGAAAFAEAGSELRDQIVEAFADGELAGGSWDGLNVERAWSVVIRGVVSAFYSHPWAWNEIGFGGPAYPRGYAAFGIGLSESWEGLEAFEVDPVSEVRERGLG